MKRKVIIKKRFRDDLKNIFEYINKDSPQNAKKFKDEIRFQLERIKSHPSAYPKLEVKDLDNDNSEYRFAHYMKTFKIIYKIPNNLLIILGIVHDRQSPEVIASLKTEDHNEE